MENASKALLMAGSVLISLIVISLLVMSFTSLKNLQQEKENIKHIDQAEEFNRQYEAYAREVYGSEILSLVNKIDDYNKTEAENEGYTRIEISVNFKNDFNYSTYFKKGVYDSTKLLNEIAKVGTNKAIITELKGRKFKFESFEYDKNTGRIIKMSYSL